MAILCSPVSSQLDGGEGHREVQARSALCVAARCGRERSRGHAAPGGPADWRRCTRGGAACAQCLEALEAPANAVDLLPRRDVLYRTSQCHTTPVPLACQVPGQRV